MNNGLTLDLNQGVNIVQKNPENLALKMKAKKDVLRIQGYYDEIKAELQNSHKTNQIFEYERQRCLTKEEDFEINI